VAARYQAGLADVPEVKLPPAPDVHPDFFDTYQNYEVLADQRDALRDHLRANGIGTLVQWGGKAIHQIEGLGLRASLPKTEAYFERCVLLPMNLFLSDDDVDYVVQTVRGFYGR
jgi:dTDP-4-amino-4,6-dideoxygalactose transaminase